jgi:hypothetical protein
MAEQVALTRDEVLQLAGVDSEFFCRTFFPKTFRQASPHFHQEMDDLLDNPYLRLVGFKVFRGGAKTTKLRAALAKRISYGLSRSAVIVSNSQSHSGYTLRWLSKQVRFNRAWADFYRLRPGDIWREGEHLEIINDTTDTRTNVLGLGITGQIRGINLDDWRPDYIVVDDADNEETTGTEEQRKKTSDLLGSLEKALAPASEAPMAKMAVAQTPINLFDYISTISKPGTGWSVSTFGCFDDSGKSRWEQRFPTVLLEADKARHIRLGKLSLWLREMECRVIASEKSSFRQEWLQFYDEDDGDGFVVLAIDPASSTSKTADDQVLIAVRFRRGRITVLEYTAEKGEDPDALWVSFVRMVRAYRPRKVVIESVAYQRTLRWYFEKRMREAGFWVVINPDQDARKKADRRQKADRIIQALTTPAALGQLYIRKTHLKLIDQFISFAPDIEMHDDVLDALAMAVEAGTSTFEGDYMEVDDNMPTLRRVSGCP